MLHRHYLALTEVTKGLIVYQKIQGSAEILLLAHQCSRGGPEERRERVHPDVQRQMFLSEPEKCHKYKVLLGPFELVLWFCLLITFSCTGNKRVKTWDLSCLLLLWCEMYESQLGVLCFNCWWLISSLKNCWSVSLHCRIHWEVKIGIEKSSLCFCMADRIQSFVTVVNQVWLPSYRLPLFQFGAHTSFFLYVKIYAVKGVTAAITGPNKIEVNHCFLF